MIVHFVQGDLLDQDAGINLLWRASERSIRDSVRNALALATEHGFRSIAFPRIGAGSGGFNQERAQSIMLDELQKLESPLDVTVVVFRVRLQGIPPSSIGCGLPDRHP